MSSAIVYVIISAIVVIFLSRIFEPVRECPVCGSHYHWVQRYWGADRYYDEEYCAICKRSLYDVNTGKMKTYSKPQDWV